MESSERSQEDMKTRIITLLLIGIIALSLAACGQSGAVSTVDDASQKEE